MKRLFAIGLMLILANIGLAQNQQGQFVASAGIGGSLGMTTLKTGLNIGLKEIGLAKAKGSVIFNGMLDYGITDKFSLGFGYTTNQFNWNDDFKQAGPNDTLSATPDSIIVNAAVKIKRQNFALRGGVHLSLGDQKNHDVYIGTRLGFSLWQTTVEGEIEGLPESGFKFPTSLPSFQVALGYRYYFTPYSAIHAELGAGTGPYFAHIGLSLAMPGNN